MANVISVVDTVDVPLALVEVRPFDREGCATLGVFVACLNSDNSFAITTGFRLGRFALLPSPSTATGGFAAATRDCNGMWSELAFTATTMTTDFEADVVEASIGSGATDDNHIASPGITFHDMAHGSAKSRIYRTLVGPTFLDEVRAPGWPGSKVAFQVKFDSLDMNEAQLMHRLWRALQGTQTPFFLEFVEPALGSRTTGVSNRYIVRFRDAKYQDSIHAPAIGESQFSLVEHGNHPSGGQTYEPVRPALPDIVTPLIAPHVIDTKFQFEGDSALTNSPKWAAGSGPGTILVAPVVVAIAAPGTPTGTPYTTGGILGAASSHWTYKVTALSPGGESAPSTASTAATTTGSSSKIMLSWTGVGGAIGYKIYGRTSGSFLFIGSTDETSFTDTGFTTPSYAAPISGTSGSIVGSPQVLTCGTGACHVLYASRANRIHQRVGIEFLCSSTGASTSQAGVLLRYKDSNNYVIAYIGNGSLAIQENIAGTVTNLFVGGSPFGGANATGSLQVEVVSSRLRWWCEESMSVQDRPPDGAVDLAGSYDGATQTGWGIHMQGTHISVTRFMACEVPGAVQPPPMIVVGPGVPPSPAQGFNFEAVTLSLATDYSGAWVDWEVLPADPADFPEPFRAVTPSGTTTLTAYVRPGYAYNVRARVWNSPWSEYVPLSVGSASGTSWNSHARQLVDWPLQAYTTTTSIVKASYDFPNIVPDYVFEGVDESTAMVQTANQGKDTAIVYDRRTRRTFTLKFEKRLDAQYQVLIDFFEFAQAKILPFNWTHPTTGENFVLRFNADEYQATYTDQSSQASSAVMDLTFPCIESAPDASIVPTYDATLALDTDLITAAYPDLPSIWTT